MYYSFVSIEKSTQAKEGVYLLDDDEVVVPVGPRLSDNVTLEWLIRGWNNIPRLDTGSRGTAKGLLVYCNPGF